LGDPLAWSENSKVMKMSMELLNIAEQDLQAAEVLYENELYPQSIFYFQQSVEKANKAFALILNIVTERELFNVIGHETVNIFEKAIKHQKNKYEQFDKHLTIIPELKEIRILKNFNVKKEVGNFDLFLFDISEIKEDKNELINISSLDIRRFLKKIEISKKDFEKQMRNLSKFKINDKSWNKMKENFLELYNIVLKYNPVHAEEFKNNFEKIEPNEIEKSLKTYFELSFFAISLSVSLFYLALITLPHSTITRYPQNGSSPAKIYTKTLPIVKKLPELSEIQNNVLIDLRILNKKLEEINAKIL
jgi:HEPN domain-containing protein